MTKYIDAELLRKEIERLKDEYTDIAIDSQRGWVNANSVIDDLEQLQSQIDSLQQEQPDFPPINVALDAAQRAKEQMMKEAVEGEVMLNPYPTICLDDCKDYDFKDGQKVRIIIVKEENK